MAGIADELRELYKLKKYMILFVACFILAPLLLFAWLLTLAEPTSNPILKDYGNSLTYLYQVIVGVTIIEAQVDSANGAIIVGIFGMLNLIFIGFIASIITTALAISLKKSNVILPENSK